MAPPSAGSYRDIPVLLFGASGFIGRAVARALIEAGARLHVAARDPERARERLDGGEIAGVAADLTDDASIREAVRRVRPAITFNLAGYGVSPAERDERVAEQVNASGVRVLAGALATVPPSGWTFQRLVHVGSALEYGAATGNLTEDTEPLPTTLYGRTKLAGTRALATVARERGLRALTARLFMVYGPGEREGRLLPSLLAAARADTPLRLTSGQQRRDFTYLGDAVEGLLRLGVSDAPPGAAVNVATGVLTSIRDFVRTAARVLDIPDERLQFGALPSRPEEMQHDPVAVERLHALTGWRPTCSIEDGIRRTVRASR